MRVVVRGLNYTEVRYYSKKGGKQTVIHWRLQKTRKQEECGVWEDGKQIQTYEDMEPKG